MRFSVPFARISAACLAAMCFAPSVVPAQTITGTTPPDWPAGVTAPIAIPLPPGDWTAGTLSAVLRVGDGPEQRVTAQYEAPDPQFASPARAWILWAAGPVDRSKPITIRFEKAPAAKTAYQTKYADPLIRVLMPDGGEVLGFHHGKPEMGQRYPLTAFLNPLIGLDGEPLTALRPQDHEHHRGVFWSWVRHEQEGKSIGDWWHPTDIRVDSGPHQMFDGALLSRFTSQHTWIYTPKGGAPEPFMTESVACRIFPATHQGRAVDLDLTFTPIIDKLRIGGTLEKEKGYGGFTIRYAQATEPIIVADGKRITRDANQLRAAWADYSGVFMRRPGQPNTERTGAAVFVDPHHPDFPPEWITRLYGVLNVSYPGLRMLDLKKGQPLRLRYRMWIHRGDAVQGQVEAAYKAYAADWRWQPATTTRSAPAK